MGQFYDWQFISYGIIMLRIEVMFDVSKFKNLSEKETRYNKRFRALNSVGMNTRYIEKTVEEASDNLGSGAKSFIIYGEPQSGKTEMMIVLTARLLDEGHKVIIVLLNDNVPLLHQNLDRFRSSGIDPTPVDVTYILDKEIGNKRWIIFCKKNINDLKKLFDKLYKIKGKIIIDDEADYASPNAKINRDMRSAINKAIYDLLGGDGVYVGVTATPARLDLNNTFENLTEDWICFGPHDEYVGKDTFFPMDLSKPFNFSLNLLPDKGDDPKYLLKALLSFFVNVGYINLNSGLKNNLKADTQENACFSFLIHTSGKMADHEKDEEIVNRIFGILSDEDHKKYDDLVKAMYEMAVDKYGEDKAEEIVRLVLTNIRREFIEVLNTKKKSGTNLTNPTALFTIVIGGNIISRGITFNNLLGMFFTRDVKHRIQQDTYIQRARMFGNRKKYVNLFELWIPESLYLDWHKCFVYHYLSLEAIKTDKAAPVWISDNRVRPVATSSIDKKAVVLDTGEMCFNKFKYSKELEEIVLNPELDDLTKLKMINEKFGDEVFPSYVIDFIRSYIQPYEGYIAIHNPRPVSKDSGYHDSLYRQRGVIGGQDIARFPQAVHQIMVIYNTYNEARAVYRYAGKVQFLKNLKKKRVNV